MRTIERCDSRRRKFSGKNTKIKEFDFLYGDFNTLVKMERKEMEYILKNYDNFHSNCKELFKKDQMKILREECKGIRAYQEANIGKILDFHFNSPKFVTYKNFSSLCIKTEKIRFNET